MTLDGYDGYRAWLKDQRESAEREARVARCVIDARAMSRRLRDSGSTTMVVDAEVTARLLDCLAEIAKRDGDASVTVKGS